MKFKEAREMISEFDGNSQTKLKEILSAYPYAIKNILGVQLCFRRFFPKFEALL